MCIECTRHSRVENTIMSQQPNIADSVHGEASFIAHCKKSNYLIHNIRKNFDL